VSAEPIWWVYYPWRRTVVSVLGPRAFRLFRLDRNRNLITAAELERLGRLRIGVVGLSVGHAIAHTLAAQGLCGELRLTDFDDLELSNLNRVPATVFDLGVNKAVVCARRIAELDPYLPVAVMPAGFTAETVGDFLDDLDIVIEECDSLDAKVLIREIAWTRRLPVLMATGDRGAGAATFNARVAAAAHGLAGSVDFQPGDEASPLVRW
jgi:tRNA A37 threonylcarbamoyladenosine dehydratase